MMASIVVLLIMGAFAAFQFFKGGFIKAFTTFMAALCANIVAFGWFEQLAEVLIKRDMLANWAQSLCFTILFIVAFALLQTLSLTLIRQPISFSDMPERAGRTILGLFLGLILSGTLLTAAALAPLPNKYPYQRFDSARPNPQKTTKPLLNPDGFIARWFGIISNGSLSGDRSFAVLHAGFPDHVFLNRINKSVSARVDPGTIELPGKAAAWPAPALKDSSGNPIGVQAGSNLIVVRIGFTGKLMRAGGLFTPGQLRLLCKRKDDKQLLQGSAASVYPLGYLRSPGRIQLKGLADKISLQSQDFQQGTKYIDFAFAVPDGFEPTVVAFKANDLAMVSPLVTADEAPKPMPFILTSDCATGSAKVSPVASARIYGVEIACGQELLKGVSLTVSGRDQWTTMQTQQSIQPARFEQDKIACVRAELKKAPEPTRPDGETAENKLPGIFQIRSGYSLLSLKCNNPAVGAAISGEQLPSLIDSAGTAHRPCGLIAAGNVAGQTTFEADYCPTNLSFAEDGVIAKPFPESFRLAEKAQSISQLYILYMVKSGTILVSVQSAGAQAAAFEGAECFLVN